MTEVRFEGGPLDGKVFEIANPEAGWSVSEPVNTGVVTRSPFSGTGSGYVLPSSEAKVTRTGRYIFVDGMMVFRGWEEKIAP